MFTIEEYIVLIIIFMIGTSPVWIMSYLGIRLDRKEVEEERLKKLTTPNKGTKEQ